MKFNNHWNLEGKHAVLSASKYQWLNYSEEKLRTTYQNQLRVEMGTRLHEFAAECISLGQKLPRSRKTMNMHVNDAIGYRMSPEVVLYYSDNCFGTADAISFRDNLLRIHDLKTGTHPAKFEQLKIYAALFCLEYRVDPRTINMELRIYQNDDMKKCNPDGEEIQIIMDTIKAYDKVIQEMKESEGY